MLQVGLFRKSGVKSRIQALRQMCETSPENVNYEDQSAYDVADMVKQFFRDLPEPLLTSKMGETFLHIYQCKSISCLLWAQYYMQYFQIPNTLYCTFFLPRCPQRTTLTGCAGSYHADGRWKPWGPADAAVLPKWCHFLCWGEPDDPHEPGSVPRSFALPPQHHEEW